MQVVTNGSYGGSIGKRHPSGSLEPKKCVDTLRTLRAKTTGRGKAVQLRASNGSLVTELEMNSTFRGAVEIFNLCRQWTVYVSGPPGMSRYVETSTVPTGVLLLRRKSRTWKVLKHTGVKARRTDCQSTAHMS